MDAEPSAPEPSPPRASSRGLPWRDLLLASTLTLVWWPAALLLGFAFPLAAFLTVLDRRRRRLVAGLLGAAIPLLLFVEIPAARFFVLAAALCLAAALLALRSLRRVGYGELSVCVAAGLVGAAGVWLLVQPGFFARVGAAIEAFMLEQGYQALRLMAEAGKADATSQLLMQEAFETSARWVAQGWPAAAFAAFWLGTGPALALAARWARGGAEPELARRVRVAERCARFRLPELWVWIFLAGVVGFLLVPQAAPVHDVALNAALVAFGLYAWQGVAIALYYLERRGVRPLSRALLLGTGFLLLTFPLFVLALVLGLADAWLDLRARDARRPPAAPGA